jgi:hypothetical protein|nr:MAG TPA: hypothetical protein [Caudoviricetes sp.]
MIDITGCDYLRPDMDEVKARRRRREDGINGVLRLIDIAKPKNIDYGEYLEPQIVQMSNFWNSWSNISSSTFIPQTSRVVYTLRYEKMLPSGVRRLNKELKYHSDYVEGEVCDCCGIRRDSLESPGFGKYGYPHLCNNCARDMYKYVIENPEGCNESLLSIGIVPLIRRREYAEEDAIKNWTWAEPGLLLNSQSNLDSSLVSMSWILSQTSTN